MYDNEVLGTGFIDRIYRVVVPKKARDFAKLEGAKEVLWFVDEFDLCLRFYNNAAEKALEEERYEVLDSSKMDTKFRVVVPKKIREKVGLSSEDQVVWYTDGFNLCLKFLSSRDMHRLLVAIEREQASQY